MSDDDTRLYEVVMNLEQQSSIWPTGKDIPSGWEKVGRSGLKTDCVQYIEKIWTDMRPLSLRRKMDAVESSEGRGV